MEELIGKEPHRRTMSKVMKLMLDMSVNDSMSL